MSKLSHEELDQVTGGIAAGEELAEIVNCERRVHIRRNSSEDSQSIGWAYLGDRFPFLCWVNNWARIKYGSQVGFVEGEFVKIVE